MSFSPMGSFFGFLNTLSGSPVASRFGLDKIAAQVLYQGTKAGVRAATLMRTRFKAGASLVPDEDLQQVKPTGLFDLTLTEEQQMTRDMLRELAASELRPRAREAERERGAPDSFFAQVHELGIHDIAIPQALGGAGEHRSPVTSVLMAEDLAGGDMSLAIAALSTLGVINAVSELGSRRQKAAILPAFCQDAALQASLALAEPRAIFDPLQLATSARREAGGFTLDGVKCGVPLIGRAGAFLVFADLAGVGPRGFVVEREALGLEMQDERNMGLAGAGLGRLVLRGVHVAEDALLGENDSAYDHGRLVDLCRLGVCALAVGACQAAVDYVIAYANGRIAFGEPISHRQAIAFMIADMATELEGMRLLTYRAASRAEQGMPCHREAHLARLSCAEHSAEIGTNSVQVLGGHGYVCEHPVEMWFRDLRSVAVLEGVFCI
ncbi:MAG: acyl-CoA dehydrogenase family protein [Candidatus Schekmanbacteria bacterium]|nr:acyl-CoA dehydrogenase family protein [Candidatus Schekmanbacteria bacterium]